MIIRLGLPKTTGALPHAAFLLDAPVLVSAMSMWDHATSRFREPGEAIGDLDVALDSAGFTAIARFGGYPWTVADYVELAGLHSWTWWAQMDLCCEPEVAADAAEILRRIETTAYLLRACRRRAAALRGAGADWLADPMPVVQGWTPDDYERSADLAAEELGTWPSLVGVGSVCRRHLGGPAGLGAVLERLHRVLPPHVGLHLFGVKGSALRSLERHPRLASTDSQAWGVEARQSARKAGTPCTIARKVDAMTAWLDAQTAPPSTPQVGLFA